MRLLRLLGGVLLSVVVVVVLVVVQVLMALVSVVVAVLAVVWSTLRDFTRRREVDGLWR